MSSFPHPSLNALLAETEWVRALARRLVDSSHEAEDLAQETMTRALVSPPTDGHSLRGWLSVVLTNRLRARLRRPDPALEVARDAAPDFGPSALETVERAEAHQSVVDAVMSLPEPFRTTILLRYFEGYGPSEIAENEGVPLATVTSRLTRAHARLRDKLQSSDPSSRPGLQCLAPLLIPGRMPRAASVQPLAATPVLPFLSLLITMSTLAKLIAAAALVALAIHLGFREPEPGVVPEGDPRAVAQEAPLQDVDELGPALEPTATDGDTRVELAEGALAEMAEDEKVTADPAPSPTLTGTILRPDGTPAPGATVVVGGFGSLQFIESGKRAPDSIASATADEDGVYSLAELPGERALLTAGCAGFAPSDSVIWVPGDSSVQPLILREGVRIYGSVQRRDGSMARERQVRLMQDGGTKDPFGRRLIRFITTDDQGHFDERGLCPGNWGIVSYPDDEELEEIGGAMVDHMVQATVELEDGEEAHVPLGSRKPDQVLVTGTVTVAGEPASGILQWIREADDPMGSATNIVLADDGSYSVDLEGPGTWYVRVSGRDTGEFLPLIPKVEEHRLDMVLPTGTLTGIVVDEAGDPVKGARVSLQVTEGEFERGPLRASGDATSTNKRGEFKLKGLTQGKYLVGAVHADLGVAPSVIVSVATDQESPEITFTLRGEHRIHGRVMGPEGFRANPSPIWLYDGAGRLLNPVATLCTGKGAAFSTPPLPPGRYSIFVQSGLDVAEALDLNVEDKDLEEVELQLQPGAVLTVESLVDGDLRRALVSVSDDRGRLLTGQRFKRDPWQWRRLPFDSTRKRVGPFPPGTYTVSSHVPGVGTVTKEVTVVGAEEVKLTLRHP